VYMLDSLQCALWYLALELRVLERCLDDDNVEGCHLCDLRIVDSPSVQLLVLLAAMITLRRSFNAREAFKFCPGSHMLGLDSDEDNYKDQTLGIPAKVNLKRRRRAP
jgi:hypothetical protein